MCGVAGLCLADPSTPAAGELLEACILLQHRGQDACGIAAHEHGRAPVIRKDLGLVTDVFGHNATSLLDLRGSMGIGHGEYPLLAAQRVQSWG